MRATGALREQVSAASLSRWHCFPRHSRARMSTFTVAACAPRARPVRRTRRVFFPERPRAARSRDRRGFGRARFRVPRVDRDRRLLGADSGGRRAFARPRVAAASARLPSRLRGDARARRRVPRGPEPGGGSRGRREHGGVHVRHRDASARPDVARRRQRVVPGRGVARRVRRGRLRAGVPVLRVRQRGDEDQAGAEAAGGHRGGQRRPKGVGSVWGSGVAGAVCALAALGASLPGPTCTGWASSRLSAPS